MKNLTATKLYALAFGLFLGLCLWKFGNPVILDHKISAPTTASEFLNEPWPLHWANWVLLPLAAIGAILVFQKRISWIQTKWLWLLPIIWLGWQFISATQTVDADLTAATLWQFFGCVACYFLGALIFARDNLWRWLLPGLLAAFAFCLVRGIDQHVFEFPQNYQTLVEGERSGWTNFPPETIADMKTGGVIITTNGMDAANPAILEKFKKGRVAGTLVYPNALAGIILLLWPLSLALAFGATKKLKPFLRFAAIALTIFLGSAALFWSGSKLGWLIGLALAGIFLRRLDWPKKIKLATVAFVLILGLGIFAVRFHNYFSAGATSVGARFDYWRAAVQTTAAQPVFGTGPGTFQRPYAQIKSPEAEMARLTHNDYLEQFSDSGIVGGLTYASWIFLALLTVGKKLWHRSDILSFAIAAGLFGWFAQGFGEFGLYIPALAWTAFTLLGCLIRQDIIELDK
ncbi:MAG TPA: O-antigen ligase family protein [Verrucomicrobiae bacterium]